ncbi:ornithine cyclodeaminase [Aliiroseovarius sediminilitoris]|uniref:Ornithine cyclodeaminase n=1 Tax=Aliiroseovarius sediminilitoris TaxID=1173584 RepID=A0A1I0MJA7_9RHOB|nr:ornithine cyclodeaminase [Aliiroseovarius sediminilitoris]SEV88477.1 ornithine cyclodeaminase [Aliiroseovarius sediminilitoris]
MTPAMIPFDAETLLDWRALTDAILQGHLRPKAEIGDTFLYRGDDTMLTRSAWIDGLGIAVKTANIMPGNPARGEPMIHGAVNLYDDVTGLLDAIVDFHLVTKWKTAGDSVLGARLLARPDSRVILIVGAGTVGRNLRDAYGALFPDARFLIWNRSPDGAQKFADECDKTEIVASLEDGVKRADIITSATMTTDPLIKGDWLRPGQHLDLIGAYRPDMREADDEALTRARLFMDSRDTVLDHIGEFKDPLARGVIARDDVVGDLYDHKDGVFTRQPDDITLYKNGGGAHLDLMTSRYILEVWRAAH